MAAMWMVARAAAAMPCKQVKIRRHPPALCHDLTRWCAVDQDPNSPAADPLETGPAIHAYPRSHEAPTPLDKRSLRLNESVAAQQIQPEIHQLAHTP